MLQNFKNLVRDALVVDSEGNPLGVIERIEIEGEGIFLVLDSETPEPETGEKADKPDNVAKLRAIAGDAE